METVYYNFYAFDEAKVSGGEDHRVISLEDYRARQAGREAEKLAGDSWDEAAFSDSVPAGRSASRNRSHLREKLLAGLELAACGAIIAVAVAACVVFL